MKSDNMMQRPATLARGDAWEGVCGGLPIPTTDDGEGGQRTHGVECGG